MWVGSPSGQSQAYFWRMKAYHTWAEHEAVYSVAKAGFDSNGQLRKIIHNILFTCFILDQLDSGPNLNQSKIWYNITQK